MSSDHRPLAELEQTADFVSRHIGPSGLEIEEMLTALGIGSLDELITKTVPKGILSDLPLGLPKSRTEQDVLAELRAIADQNRLLTSLIGMGYHDTITPTVILRNVLENPGWYTAYTPYQPEISQGRLEALLNFQTMVMDLTAMELANASLLDEATAAAEAMTLCYRVSKAASDVFFVSKDCHPQTIDVLRTRAAPLGIELVVGDHGDAAAADIFGLLLQYPATMGRIEDHSALVEAVHGKGAIVCVAADLLALTLLKPPGEWGADIVVGNTQRFGVPLGFGGPHAAYFATRDDYKRHVPGRLVGLSLDARGNPVYRLALQTREQHIRREKATSNICTAQVLLAVIAGFYAVYHGPERLRTIAQRVHRLSCILASGLQKFGCEIVYDAFFDTICVRAVGGADKFLKIALEAGYNLRKIDEDQICISIDETTTAADIDALLRSFAGTNDTDISAAAIDGETASAIPDQLWRHSAFLTHPIFNSHHSETQMLRYLRRLQEKDVALDRSMIPLGSCTMKLNATTEMVPVTWREFGDIHPFAPLDQAQGYMQLIESLQRMLCEITGFASVSLQPNAGSQGEYAGLLAISRYHESRGDLDRRVCLIPSSAHGTNPASSVLAGLKVVVVGCDEQGNIDVTDLRAKASENANSLAALMVTYPSTHGVFEEAIVEICDIVHAHGGQVYMDGANMNALVGLRRPGEFGPDVAHLNLHKTFCIPHGGGGPGVGPIGLRAHLAPFAPGHAVRRLETAPIAADGASGAVAAAPWGSAGILPISWAYIALMGCDGLKKATEVAILNANYVARRLQSHYPILYAGPGGMVAHECIVDLRAFKDSADVTVEDVAKRLMDYGFHAPTMSWPVAGTLMIEPTESESKAELDRFCDAMIAIRREIEAIEEGAMDRQDNPLQNAPHTVLDVVDGTWAHPYSEVEAAFPVRSLRDEKYWPPVNRIDQVQGDRNFVCSCPPLDAYKDAAD
jgi:glycine dehydrogenase